MRPRDTRLNTPAEMLVRFIFVSRYILFFAGFFTGLAALEDRSLPGVAGALLLFAALFAGHRWLQREGRLASCERSLEAMFRGGPEPDEEDRLEALLRRREALEQRRGMPGFDPWEVQAVRREIGDYLRQHPESTRKIDDRR